MLTKVHVVKAMDCPVVMYGCEIWTIKKAEHQRIYAFELQCWRRLLRVPWTARRSNQSILKEISPEYTLEGLVLTQKLQYLGHLMWRTDSLAKTLILENIEGRRRREKQDEMIGWHCQLDGSEFEQALGVGDGQAEAWRAAVHRVTKSRIRLSNWTQLIVALQCHKAMASLIGQLVKNPPAMQETLVQFLGWEDPLEKGQATHSSISGLPLWLSW